MRFRKTVEDKARYVVLSDGRKVHECGCPCGNNELHSLEAVRAMLEEHGVEVATEHLEWLIDQAGGEGVYSQAVAACAPPAPF